MFKKYFRKGIIIENDQNIRDIVDFILEEQVFTIMSIPELVDLLAIIPLRSDMTCWINLSTQH